jgi:GntR family transcriptional regulator
MDEIDHEGAEPVYRQLAAILRAQIESGELRPGRPVPSERTLTQRYGVAVGTVKKAVEVLRSEGLVHTVIGPGHLRPLAGQTQWLMPTTS